jgi:serine/threonine protein kinase
LRYTLVSPFAAGILSVVRGVSATLGILQVQDPHPIPKHAKLNGESIVSARRVGKYEIIQEIGRGGMAVVYKTWQPSLERHVALKVLPEYFRHDPEFLARFRREARAAAQLSHPNILYVYDVGEEDGAHYIAMEYFEGGSLADRLVVGSLSIDQIQDILAQVAAGLDYAHPGA